MLIGNKKILKDIIIFTYLIKGMIKLLNKNYKNTYKNFLFFIKIEFFFPLIF